eukprot:scaffold52309_cov25-Cyclotella_meneghiniana.AAC.1
MHDGKAREDRPYLTAAISRPCQAHGRSAKQQLERGFDEGDWDEPEELDWKWIDVDFLDDGNTNGRATTPAVDVWPSRTVRL